jgi:prepilin signal peptidase PulO-like enzyme (type II secretory pathway)
VRPCWQRWKRGCASSAPACRTHPRSPNRSTTCCAAVEGRDRRWSTGWFSNAVCEGAAIGAIFWLLKRLYFAFRKIQGLGLGDVKFLAAAALWIGVRGIPTLLLIATLTALVAAGSLQLAGRGMTRQTSLPFGPFLAIGLLLTLILQQFLSAV